MEKGLLSNQAPMESSSKVAATSAATCTLGCHLTVTIETADGGRSEIEVRKPFARIGRDRRAEVALDDPLLSPCHAYLQATGEGVYCAGLAAGVPSAWLLPNATMQLAGFRIHASVSTPRGSDASAADLQSKHSAASPFPQLRVYSEKSGGGFTDFTLNRRLTLVGRESPAVWRIKHRTLSRIHCVLSWEEGELWLIDLFSSNGTRVSGKRFDAGLLEAGQEFKLGQVRCCYLGTAASDVNPANRVHDASGSASEVMDYREPTAMQQADSYPRQFAERQDRAGQNIEQKLSGFEQRIVAVQTDVAAELEASAEKQAQTKSALIAVEQRLVQLEEAWRGDCEQWQVRLESVLSEAEQRVACRVAELAERSQAERDEFERQRQRLEDSHRNELRSLGEELKAASAEDQGRRDLALDEVRTLSLKLEHGQAAVTALATQMATVAEQFERQRASAEKAVEENAERVLGFEARWEQRLERASLHAAQQSSELADRLAQLENTVGEVLRARQEAEPPMSSERGSDESRMTSSEIGLAQELSRVAGDLQIVQDDLKHFQTALSDVRAGQHTLNQRQAAAADQADDVERRRQEDASRWQQVEQDYRQQLVQIKAEWLAQVAEFRQQTEQIRQDYRCAASDLNRMQDSVARLSEKLEEQSAIAELALGSAQERSRADVPAPVPTWEDHLQELAAEWQQRGAERDRQLSAFVAATDERIMRLEGTLTAKMVELQSRQQQLTAEMKSAAVEKNMQVAPTDVSPEKPEKVSLPVIDVPFASDVQVASAPPRSAHAGKRPALPADAEDMPGDGQAPEWLVNDELTQRLLDFRAKRERIASRRRIFWSLAAGGLVLVILAAAGVMRFWLHAATTDGGDVVDPGTAAASEQLIP